jgi:hypothetical protein
VFFYLFNSDLVVCVSVTISSPSISLCQGIFDVKHSFRICVSIAFCVDSETRIFHYGCFLPVNCLSLKYLVAWDRQSV